MEQQDGYKPDSFGTLAIVMVSFWAALAIYVGFFIYHEYKANEYYVNLRTGKVWSEPVLSKHPPVLPEIKIIEKKE